MHREIEEGAGEVLGNLEDTNYMECCGEIFPSAVGEVDGECRHCGCEGPPVNVVEILHRYNHHDKLLAVLKAFVNLEDLGDHGKVDSLMEEAREVLAKESIGRKTLVLWSE